MFGEGSSFRGFSWEKSNIEPEAAPVCDDPAISAPPRSHGELPVKLEYASRILEPVFEDTPGQVAYKAYRQYLDGHLEFKDLPLAIRAAWEAAAHAVKIRYGAIY